MSRNPDKESGYLQDVVVPKEETREPQGFDIDRECGEGTRQLLEQGLRHCVSQNMPEQLCDVWYRVLFGVPTFESKSLAGVIEKLRSNFKSGLALHAAHSAAYYRILEGTIPPEAETKAERLKQELRDYTSTNLNKDSGDPRDLWDAAKSAALYRILFDEIPLDRGALQRLMDEFRPFVKEYLSGERLLGYVEAAAATASLRILKAREIKFIPGKGIEIIDAPPQEFQKKPIPPMPEERKF